MRAEVGRAQSAEKAREAHAVGRRGRGAGGVGGVFADGGGARGVERGEAPRVAGVRLLDDGRGDAVRAHVRRVPSPSIIISIVHARREMEGVMYQSSCSVTDGACAFDEARARRPSRRENVCDLSRVWPWCCGRGWLIVAAILDLD